MKCSEYIYTSWKNGGTNSGFTTFSQSNDITAEERDEIVVAMTYVKPAELPDENNAEEIERNFPRNSVYFRLKSGRYCMAQASYVGEDYAVDVNARWGNFIIHAYLFDSADGEFALSYLDSCFFKRCLTHEEREYPGVVTPEPVTLVSHDPIEYGEDSLSEILENGEENEFFLFVQAVIDRINSDANIIVGIKDRNKVNRFMRAMVLVLPKPFLDKITFGTYLLYKEPAYKINFIYNYNAFNVDAEMASFPENAVLFFDTDEIRGVSGPGEYLFEYRSCLMRNRMAAYRFKEDMDRIYSADHELSLEFALLVKHYIKKDLDYFGDFDVFEKITRYVLEKKTDPRVSEIVLYMIRNSDFDEERKNGLFFIGDLFCRLDENEQITVRGDFFENCFLTSDDVDDFIAKYGSNDAVAGGHTPLTYDFFCRFSDSDKTIKEKLVRYVVELAESKYDEFDDELKFRYFKIAELYFKALLSKKDYLSAENVLYVMKNREVYGNAGAANLVIKKLIDEGFSGWNNTSFSLAMMRLAEDDRDVYWGLFNRIVNSLDSSSGEYSAFIDGYAAVRLENSLDFDADIVEYADKLGFGDHITALNYSLFVIDNDKSIYDFASAYNGMFGSLCPYEEHIEKRNNFFSQLSTRFNSLIDIKESKPMEKYRTWADNFSAFVASVDREKANYDILEWVSYELERNISYDEFAEVAQSVVNLISVEDWAGYEDNCVNFPKLLLYLDIVSVVNRSIRTVHPLYYVSYKEDLFMRIPSSTLKSFIRGLTGVVLRDVEITREECNDYISPLIVCGNYRYRNDVHDSIAEAFDYAIDNNNIEPFAWLVDYYVENLSDKVVAENIEEKLIFRILTKHRKSILTIVDENKNAYFRVASYFVGLTFNVFGKAKRVAAMNVRR